mgnify:CR=1 FL=1
MATTTAGDGNPSTATTSADELAALCALVVDPEDHRTLRPAPAITVRRLMALQASGALRDRSGERVIDGFDALLVREGDDRAFPVRAGVADLLPGSAITLEDDDLAPEEV